MTEQKQKNNPPKVRKKPHFVSRIVWLAWVSVLLLLLAAGLFLEAPWKITTLVFIFLLAATILPRAYRKWFWAVVGCAAAVVIVWIFLPEETEGWRPYTFEKELAALEAKRAIPDRENAFIIYNQLLEDCNEAFFKADFFDLNFRACTGEKPWSSKDCPEMARWLRERDGAIAKLIEASETKQCRFPISADVTHTNTIINRLRPIQSWAFLLGLAANNDIAEGRTKDGLQKHISMLQIGKHLNQQPSQLDFMVGSGIELRATNQFKKFAVTGNASEEHLILIEKALAEIKREWSNDWPEIVDYEKLLAKNLWGQFYEVNPEGKIRFTRSSIDTIREHILLEMSEESAETYWDKRFMKASAVLCWFCLPSAPQETGATIDSAYERCYAMAKPGFRWPKIPEELALNTIKFNHRYAMDIQLCVKEPTYYSIHDTYLRTMSQQRGGRLIVALRRYKNKNGTWPGSLDDIKSSASDEIFIDPINSGSFVYKLTDENFMLYSKGKNGRDDGGRRDNWFQQTGADDLMIWPSEESETK